MPLPHRYKITIPHSISLVLANSEVRQEIDQFVRVKNVLIGNIDVALKRMWDVARQRGFVTVLMSNCVQGDVKKVAAALANLVKGLVSREDDVVVDALKALGIENDLFQEVFDAGRQLGEGRPLCLISGGEPVVRVEGNGVGGRNQEPH